MPEDEQEDVRTLLKGYRYEVAFAPCHKEGRSIKCGVAIAWRRHLETIGDPVVLYDQRAVGITLRVAGMGLLNLVSAYGHMGGTMLEGSVTGTMMGNICAIFV